jgi:prepilin peptidase CpaA
MLVTASIIPFAVLTCLLAASSHMDLTTHRIPNFLTFGGVIAGLGLQLWFLGMAGLLSGLGGLALGLVLYLPLYIFGGMGAGDVKLLAAVGTFLGIKATVLAAAFSLAAGAVIGIGVLLARGIFPAVLRRYALTIKCLLCTGNYISPAAADASLDTRFPYGIAIAIGTLATVFWLST